MKAEERKPLSQITRAEWITYQWLDATAFGDRERMLLRGLERTPDEAAQAARNWDAVIDIIRHEKEQ